MTTLSDFLLAKIAEDEATARAATIGPWAVHSEPDIRPSMDPYLSVRGNGTVVLDASGEYCGDLWLAADRTDLNHIVRHDPVRALAECEAKRRIVAEHADINADWTPLFGDAPEDRPLSRCQTCTSDADPGYLSPFPCRTLRLLALPYASHPGYLPEWAP